jgi:ribonucleotide monophosphatase NagD (HAD superfamily)
MADSSSPPILNGLSDIAGDYDAVICDVWGVLHNGRDSFLPAADAMRRFRKERGPVVLLSNAPRLADGVEGLFDRVGLPRDFYDGIVTSGLAARDDLLRRAWPHPASILSRAAARQSSVRGSRHRSHATRGS